MPANAHLLDARVLALDLAMRPGSADSLFSSTQEGATGGDLLVGGDGDDMLIGGDGSDFLISGFGQDASGKSDAGPTAESRSTGESESTFTDAGDIRSAYHAVFAEMSMGATGPVDALADLLDSESGGGD
jgi:Ca2+-binding RTX toxin-like protein